VDIVSSAASATPGLGRYPPFKREVISCLQRFLYTFFVARSLDVSSIVKFNNQVVTIASAALDGFKNEAKKMVVALVDMERAFVPPQHFIRLVQRRYAQ
jgi:dynamin GTPase